MGSRTSWGFSNDTVVKIWNSKRARDRYVDTCDNMSVKAIQRNEVTRYATNFDLVRNRDCKPSPFSGEYWGIRTPDDSYDEYDSFPEGYVGCIDIGCDQYPLTRFYK